MAQQLNSSENTKKFDHPNLSQCNHEILSVSSASGCSAFYGFTSNANESGGSNDKIVDSIELLDELNVEEEDARGLTIDLDTKEQTVYCGKIVEMSEKVATPVDNVSIVEIKSSSVSSSEEHCRLQEKLENPCEYTNSNQPNCTATAAVNKTREIDNYCTVSESSSEFPQSNTSADHSVERRLALLAKKRPQLNLLEKINNWYRESDVSDVEDVLNFEHVYSIYVERRKKSLQQLESLRKDYVNFEQFYNYLLHLNVDKMAPQREDSSSAAAQPTASSSGINVTPKKRPLKYNKLMKSKDKEQNQYSSSDNDMIDYGPSKRKKHTLEKSVNTLLPNIVYHDKPFCPSSSEDNNSGADNEGNFRSKANMDHGAGQLKGAMQSLKNKTETVVKRRNLLPSVSKPKNTVDKDNFFSLNRLIREIDKGPKQNNENGLIKIRYDFVRESNSLEDFRKKLSTKIGDAIFKRPVSPISPINTQSLFHIKEMTSQLKSSKATVPHHETLGTQHRTQKSLLDVKKSTNASPLLSDELADGPSGPEKHEFCSYLGLAGMSTANAITHATEELSKCHVARRSLRVRQLQLQERKSKNPTANETSDNVKNMEATENSSEGASNISSRQSPNFKSPSNSPTATQNSTKEAHKVESPSCESTKTTAFKMCHLLETKERINKRKNSKDVETSVTRKAEKVSEPPSISPEPLKTANTTTGKQNTIANLEHTIKATSNQSIELEKTDLREEIRMYFENKQHVKPSICIRQSLCNVNQTKAKTPVMNGTGPANNQEPVVCASDTNEKDCSSEDKKKNGMATETAQPKNGLGPALRSRKPENGVSTTAGTKADNDNNDSKEEIEIKNEQPSLEETSNVMELSTNPVVPKEKTCHKLTILPSSSQEIKPSATEDAYPDGSKVLKLDSSSQTEPEPRLSGIKLLSSTAETVANPLNKLNGEILHIFFEHDTLIVIQEEVISFWKFQCLANALIDLQRKPVLKPCSDDSSECSSLSADFSVHATKSNSHNTNDIKSEWIKLGEVERSKDDFELRSPYQNRLCVINSTPVYIEARCQEILHQSRDCDMVSLFINLYYFDTEIGSARSESINIDSLACSPSEIMYTVLPKTHYFILCWNYTNGTSKKVSARICKYALTPQLRTLASIREFQTLCHVIHQVECFHDKFLGLGDTQLTVWDCNGDILMDYDLKMPLGRSLGCFLFSNTITDANNTMLLFQCMQCNNNINNNNNSSNHNNNNNNNNNNNDDGDHKVKESVINGSRKEKGKRLMKADEQTSSGSKPPSTELGIFACRISHCSPKYHRFHSIRSPVFDDISNSFVTDEHVIVSSKSNEEIWISRTNPNTVVFVPAQNSQRFYSRNDNRVIEVTDNSLTVDGIASHLVRLATNKTITR